MSRIASLKLNLKVLKPKCCGNKTLYDDKISLRDLKGNKGVEKVFRINTKRFILTVKFKDEEKKESEQQNENKGETIKFLKIANLYESFKEIAKTQKGTNHTTEEDEDEDEDEGEDEDEDEDEDEEIGATDFKSITKEEISNPDILKNLASLLYCTEKFKQYDGIVKKCLQDKKMIPADTRKKYLLFQQQKIGIESAIENEQVTFDQYMGFLKKSLEHDKILAKYFKKTKEEEKMKLVKFRMKCTEKEINEEVDDVSDDGNDGE
mmetsp:Transcript_4870/g.4112  ORF Transcript_4870/g.4112 Transcript_4870/m.4112 type:complete len:264 (+) Transcript_4870:401-1192(+)